MAGGGGSLSDCAAFHLGQATGAGMRSREAPLVRGRQEGLKDILPWNEKLTSRMARN